MVVEELLMQPPHCYESTSPKFDGKTGNQNKKSRKSKRKPKNFGNSNKKTQIQTKTTPYFITAQSSRNKAMYFKCCDLS
jgi:hypothetical protein